jgi:hypothetical protein
MISVLVCMAVTVCLVVALKEKDNEKHSFKMAFQGLGGQLVTMFESQLKQHLGVVDKCGMKLTMECKND